VHRLHAAGILFAITGGRPPRGMGMLVKPIDLQSPLAACSGLSIAMGNADPQVKRAARRITDTNDNDGSARAVERTCCMTAAWVRSAGISSSAELAGN